MASPRPLDMLLRLAREKYDGCAKAVAASNLLIENAKRQLTLLQEYRYDYLNRLQGHMASGMIASDCQNYQQFIATLDGAIGQQSMVCHQAEEKLSAARQALKMAHHRLSAYDALIKRERAAQIVVRNRVDQRICDELASKRSPNFAPV